MRLGEELGVTVREKNIELYDVINADEAFFTATPFSILPCTKINGVSIGSGRTGPLTKGLIDAWSQSVGVDIIAQAKRYGQRHAANVGGAANTYRFNTPARDDHDGD